VVYVHKKVQFQASVHVIDHTCDVILPVPIKIIKIYLLEKRQFHKSTVWVCCKVFKRCWMLLLAFFQCWVNWRTCRRTLRNVKSECFFNVGEGDDDDEPPPVSSGKIKNQNEKKS